jgi:hypothetical protein
MPGLENLQMVQLQLFKQCLGNIDLGVVDLEMLAHVMMVGFSLRYVRII